MIGHLASYGHRNVIIKLDSDNRVSIVPTALLKYIEP